MRDTALAELLRCPETHQPLERRGDRLQTRDGQRSYPVTGGVPVLLRSDNALFDASAIAQRQSAESSGHAGLRRAFARLRSRNVAAGRSAQVVLDQLAPQLDRGERPALLVVGGRVVGRGMSPLLDHPGLHVVETDVALGPRTALVCDGHDLPFADASFDAVVCQAVLEHVIEPPRVAAEIRRVLRPGGVVLSEIPFLQGVHEGAYDFTRYSLLGHRLLWRDFEEVDAGVACGPGMALGWATGYFLRAVAGSNRPLRAVFGAFSAVLTALLARADGWLARTPGGEDGASSTYFIGRRAEAAASDRELLDRYSGAGPRADWSASSSS
ncbi:MAG: methyltransferase domain-containing protein [Baekduia sp.]